MERALTVQVAALLVSCLLGSSSVVIANPLRRVFQSGFAVRKSAHAPLRAEIGMAAARARLSRLPSVEAQAAALAEAQRAAAARSEAREALARGRRRVGMLTPLLRELDGNKELRELLSPADQIVLAQQHGTKVVLQTAAGGAVLMLHPAEITYTLVMTRRGLQVIERQRLVAPGHPLLDSAAHSQAVADLQRPGVRVLSRIHAFDGGTDTRTFSRKVFPWYSSSARLDGTWGDVLEEEKISGAIREFVSAQQ